MVIGLFGFTFAHENMGCQALTCSFLELLQKNFPDEEIEVIRFSSEDTMGLIPQLFPNIKFLTRKIKLKDIKLRFLDEIRKCDIIFDEMNGDGFSDIYFTKSIYKATVIKLLCESTGVPYVFTPQTYGPFKHKSLEWLAGKAIRGAMAVYARDDISSKYAEKISGREVKTVTDLAFALPYKKTLSGNTKRLGLNVSGLLWEGGFSGNTNQFGLKTDYKTYCREIIKYGIKNGYEVHLISHVTNTFESDWVIPDGDYPICQLLAEEFPEAVLAPCFDSPYDVKNYISSMDVFIGARMHATIAAFSSGVITIPFAYSRKFKGLYGDLGYNYFVDGTKEETEVIVKKTIDFIANKEKLFVAQKSAMEKIEEKSQCFENDLRKLIQKILSNSTEA